MEIANLYQHVKNTLFNDVAPFWIKYGADNKNGGIYTCLDRNGNIYSTDKGVWMQGRTGYTYYNLINEYGYNSSWMEIADSCSKFLDEHCIDQQDGRMYFTVTAEGKPLRKRRYFFSECFYVLIKILQYKVKKDDEALFQARKYYDFLMSMYADPASDPYKITPKTIAETRETRALGGPMILLNITNVLIEIDSVNKEKYACIAKQLIKDIFTFRHEKTGLMLEGRLVDGSFYFDSATGRIINPGHSIELSWFLADSAHLLGDRELLKKAEDIFIKAYNFGKDEEFGGILYFKDIEGKPVEAYEHDMKLWWVHTEAITAAIKFYDYTGDEKYLSMFKEFYEYANKYFADPEFGEWYGYLRRDGRPTEPACKGHTYKGPFHLIRMLVESEKILKKYI